MATSKGQRIGIWVIAIVMTVGTIGSFAVMVLSNQNDAKDAAAAQAQVDAQQKIVDELSAKYIGALKPYKSTPAVFDASKVDSKVATNDLVVGTGADITADSKYKAYYIGWTPDGKTFDSSFTSDTALTGPIDTGTTTLIDGWNQGVVGMKVGGIREITIPSSLAYGSTGSGSTIPPNTPIKFIIMIIATD
jgi:FKBP-type peptidyl-prolyl cis-trans isomerase FkpA